MNLCRMLRRDGTPCDANITTRACRWHRSASSGLGAALTLRAVGDVAMSTCVGQAVNRGAPCPDAAAAAAGPFSNDFSMDKSILEMHGDVRKLKASEKEWLGLQIAKRVHLPKYLAQRYKISPCRLSKYASKVRQGAAFSFKSGRAQLLDETSLARIEYFVADNNHLSYDILQDQLVEMINAERIETLVRRRAMAGTSGVGVLKRVSRRTIHRYLKMFITIK